MRDVVFGVLIAALGLAFTFVYAETITRNTSAQTAGLRPTASSINEAESNKQETRQCKEPPGMSPGQSVVGQAYRRNRLTHQKTPVAATMTYNNKIGAPEIALLRVLSGCPQGATEYHLVTRHNVAPSTIFRLVEAGLLHARTHRMAGFGWSVTRLMISVAGRVAFEKAGSEECGANLMGQADLS